MLVISPVCRDNIMQPLWISESLLNCIADENNTLLSDSRQLDGNWTDIQNGGEYDQDERLTPAERRYMERLQKIELERLAKAAKKSHRDRIQEFNQYLANLSEHYDIPKVGPG